MKAKEKALHAIASVGKNAALEQRGIYCRVFYHQPRMPARLLAMKAPGK